MFITSSIEALMGYGSGGHKKSLKEKKLELRKIQLVNDGRT